MPENTITSFLKEFWRNRLARYSLLIGTCGLLFFLAMPIASKYFLKQWLLNNGADQATIGKIKMNPVKGRLYLSGVHVKRHGESVLSNSTVYVDLGIQALFDREALLQKATVTDTTIDIKRYDDGSLRIGSYRTGQDEQPDKEEEGMPWIFRARQVSFSDVLIRYSQSGLDLSLLIEQATLEMLSTDPQGASGSLELMGTLNDAPVRLQLSVIKISPELHLEGNVEVSDFQLAQLEKILKDQPTMLQGELKADTSLVVKQNESGFKVALKGEIALANLDVRAADWAGSGNIALDGELGYSALQTAESSIVVDGLLIAQPLFFAMPENQLRLEEPTLTLKGRTTIGSGDPLHAESNATLCLTDASFKLAGFTVTTGPGSWSGTIDYASANAKEPMRVTVDGGIDLQDLTVSSPGTVVLRQKQVKSQGVTEVRKAESLKVGYQGSIGLLSTGLELESLSLAGDFAYDGGLGYTSLQSEKGNNIMVDGRLIAEQLSFTMPEKEMSLRESSLTLQGKTDIGYGESLTVNSDAALSLAETVFKRADLAVLAGSGSWTGTVEYNSGKADEPLQLAADGGIDLQDFKLSLPGTVELRQGHVALRGVAEIFSGDPLETLYKGTISLTDSSLQTELLSLAGEKILWQGDSGYSGGPDSLQKTVQLDGSLNVLEAAAGLPDSTLQTAAGSFALESDSEITFGGEEFGYDGTTALEIADLQVAAEKNPLATISTVSVDRFRGYGKKMVIDKIVLQPVKLPQSSLLPVQVTADVAEIQNIVAEKNLQHVTFDKLIIDNTSVTDGAGAGDDLLAQLGTLSFVDGTLQDLKEVEVAGFRIDNGAFLSEPRENDEKDSEPLVTVGSASASPLRWSGDKGTRIETVELNNLSARYRIEEEKAEATPTEAEAEPNSRDDRAIPLQIENLTVGGDSALYVTDTTVDPAFATAIAINTLTMSNIDLNRPQKPVPFELEAQVDKYAPLTVSGSFAPLARPFSLKQTAKLQNYSLQSLSPYVVEAVGLALVSGQVDLSSELSITGEKISSDNKLIISNLEIAKRDEERSRGFEKKLPVPIDLAVDMLSDRQGRISLSIPVNGTLSDLQVGIQDIVVTAVTKAITGGIAPALAYTALGPGGALAYFGMKIGQSLLSTDLPILEFAPNASMLTSQQKATLAQIGQRLEQNMADTTKTYSICPKVVPGETGPGEPSLSDEERRLELYELGEKRAQAVKSFLLENFKVDKDRMFICNPTLNYGDSARGTVIIRE